MKRTQQNLNKDSTIKVIPHKKKTDVSDDVSKTEAVVNTETAMDPNALQKTEIIEEQYDPNQEFKIFGVGNKRQGGLQTLQQKMNMADANNEDGTSDEEDVASRGSKVFSTPQRDSTTKALEQTENPLKNPLDQSGFSTQSKLNVNYISNATDTSAGAGKNNLPED